MTRPCRAAGVLAGLLVCLPLAAAATAPAKPSAPKLPITGLAPAKLVPDLCLVRYRVSTTSPECQAFFDQGLGYWYSYVWMEAARSFETATRHDPECALAWWGLSRALERWGRMPAANQAAQKAHSLRSHASHREQLLIQARMQEKGLLPGVGNQDVRKRAAIETIDTLLALYDDDEEGWYYRAQLAGGDRLFGGVLTAVPFYKALLRVNPLHPGANHELLHFYEGFRRPALGWVYAENYIKSSPGIPHPFHMQAHLATRLGRWDKTSDRSAHAIELERAYHKEMHVAPRDDAQYTHHLEIATVSLIHDGRYREAHAIRSEVERCGWRHPQPWFRLAVAERNWAEALRIARQYFKNDKPMASYLAARVFLAQGDVARAKPEIEVLQQAAREHKDDTALQLRLWETQGEWMCQTGDAAAGLKLLARAADRSKNDYFHHSWGNGAYYMEAWGEAALRAGRADMAEEAFQEALAHDPGSVRGALGMQVLCERQGRGEEAARYADLAHRCWRRADPGLIGVELAQVRGDRGPARVQAAKPSAPQTAAKPTPTPSPKRVPQ